MKPSMLHFNKNRNGWICNSSMKSKTILGFIIFSLLHLVFSFSLKADDGISKLQIARIKNMMKGQDYAGAWRVVQNLQQKDSSSAELYYLGGSCHYEMGNTEETIKQLERSVKLNPNKDERKYFLLARTYQLQGNLIKAISHYKEYLDLTKIISEEQQEATLYLKQCNNAIELMKNPYQVDIQNMGDSINSEYPDYNPSLSADGNTMIFTSRRPDGMGSKQDPYDGKYFEDIYITTKDSVTGRWKSAKSIEGKLNTDGHDANMCLSADGSRIFVYRNMGDRGSGEIFISTKGRTGKWGEASKVQGKVNTSYFESSACLSPDGKALFFVSERPRGSFGRGDIYISKKISKTEFGAPENIGPSINDEYDQIGVFIHPDGKSLYFASDNPIGLGGYDIYKSTLVNGQWSAPVNMGYPINTPKDERFFQLSTDGKYAFFSSNRTGGQGDNDIWMADLTNYSATQTPEKKPEPATPIAILKGNIIDQNTTLIPDAEIIITNKSSGKTVTINSDDDGKYFITLEAENNFTIKVRHPGFRENAFDLFIESKENGTNIIQKIITLEKN